MTYFAAPIPSEIIPWIQGFSSTYLDLQTRLTPNIQEIGDHAGTALVNFHVHVMVPSRVGHPFLGSDRLKIARSVTDAHEDEVADWERTLETIDPLWKKSFCAHLSQVTSAMFRGGLLAGFGAEPVWVEDLIEWGLKAAVGERLELAPSQGMPPTGIRFLEKSLLHALSKGDVNGAMDVIARIDDLNPPGAAAFLRKSAWEFLSEGRIKREPNVSRKSAVSLTGQKALMTLARRRDADCLRLLSALAKGDAVLFGESSYGGRVLSPQSVPVFRTIAEAVVAGEFGLEGQHVLESYLKDQNYVLPYDSAGSGKTLGESALRAVFKYRSGLLLLRLLAKNSGLDDTLERDFRNPGLYFTMFHLNLLEPLARQGRTKALRWILKREDLIAAVRRSPSSGRDLAVQSLSAVYHQTKTQDDREAVADLMEITGHDSAVAFFQGEIARLAHVFSLREFVRTLLWRDADVRDRLQMRIDRILERRRSRSA